MILAKLNRARVLAETGFGNTMIKNPAVKPVLSAWSHELERVEADQ
jgi:hypothetical protein